MNTIYEECIKACIECMEACNHCYDSCLKEEDVSMMAGCIRLDRECADICALAIKSMQSNSPFAKQICQLCADICEACGNECKKHEHDHCQKCAEACFRCAEECHKLAA
ncbi:four-helix bundle copper-binding protein [Pseudobacillus wudalianchiensis]|uniref:Four-helix bundle copper-binding protein n=1 Tax=Pseudobacillus wudalianchiensis TaxID=1743143 RepID=A0A1B9AME9_9BACI|nr:four-helix bundle copper-binding protein [Bacillus wudalianchiensis]OCA85093.1 four-helix bundle copper-binding protein [Bacillus wudalianchiensis]